MKKLILILNIFIFSSLNAGENLKFFVKKSIDNNLQLNAQRKSLESSKQEKNISRSEFLPSITISGDQTSTTSTNRTNKNGVNLSDSNSDTESKTVSIEQKIFSGFKGVNTFKKSELEKQKAKFTYGILERQFRNLFEKASRSKGVTGEVLLQLCESRLDNLVYRFGLSPSRSGARQLVSHRHITVNGSVVNIPSYQAKEGDVIGVREKSKTLNIIQETMTNNESLYEWLSWNKNEFIGTFVSIPERIQIPENIKEQLIVELYSK